MRRWFKLPKSWTYSTVPRKSKVFLVKFQGSKLLAYGPDKYDGVLELLLFDLTIQGQTSIDTPVGLDQLDREKPEEAETSNRSLTRRL